MVEREKYRFTVAALPEGVYLLEALADDSNKGVQGFVKM
ncbi:MAG: hypothetical protein ACI85F_000099 [Bacteroidia bacterium]|jgi:hypothetical protein